VTRRRDGGTRLDDGATRIPSSVPEIGRLLRRARTRQGLRVEDVAARGGLNAHQLEALESGTVDRIPDRVSVLQTLRRYADFLGLPGDRFVLALVEHWPSPGGPAGAAPLMVPVAAPAEARPVSVAVQWPSTPSVTTGALPPGAVTRLTSGPTLHTQVPSVTAQVPLVVNTGVTPAVRAAPARTRPPWRATVVLSATIGVLTVAVLVGIAALLVHRYEPRWLVDLGITHSPGPAAHHGGGTPTTQPAATLPKVTLTTKSAQAPSMNVTGASYQVTVAAVGGPSWVQVTKSGQASPAFSGVLAAGQSKVFPVSGGLPLALDLGSAAAHITVTTGLHVLRTYTPASAPETLTITGTS
jgi:transcriptional regulator with XRE-family HTH domain